MIFVDVDNTLLLYSITDSARHPYGVLRGEHYIVHHKLVKRLLDKQEPMIVWSGGGRDYARLVVQDYIPELKHASFELKDRTTLYLI